MKIKKTYFVIDPLGLHARPASKLVGIASKFKCEITANYKSRKANVKSILNLLSLTIHTESEFTIKFNGPDAAEAEKAITQGLKDNNLIK